MAMTPDVVVLGKEGCHLCADAAAVVAEVCADLGIPWREQSILSDPVLVDQYAELIPVVLIDGEQHDFLRIDPNRLRISLNDLLNR
jgi:hypothetical protein